MHKKWKARNYRLLLSKEDKEQFELKILAESLFKGKKKSYAKSVGPRFQNNRLGAKHKALRESFVNNILPRDEIIKVKYCPLFCVFIKMTAIVTVYLFFSLVCDACD